MSTPLDALQAPAMVALDVAHRRALQVVDPAIIALVTARIEAALTDGPSLAAPAGERERDVAAVIDQMMLDVSGTDDELVDRASRHFPDGGLADVVMAAYIIEARTRLRAAADLLWPSP